MNLKDDKTGEMFFKIVDCVMVCDTCKKKDRTEWLNCNHIVQPAFWLDSRKTQRIKILFKTNPALGAREMQVTKSRAQRALPAKPLAAD